MKTMKKAQAGASMPKKPAAKPAVKKSMAPTPKKRTYPIIPDETTSDGYLKLGPREKTSGGGFSKNGGKIKKAKDGGAFGMLSVKAGIDKNPNPTAADRIAGAKKMAKSGASMKKCKYGCK